MNKVSRRKCVIVPTSEVRMSPDIRTLGPKLRVSSRNRSLIKYLVML